MPFSCYVHIPFCASICSYCDFMRIKMNEDIYLAWKKQLISEIASYDIKELNTLYYGGGTPSLLDLNTFEEITQCFPRPKQEFTIECNPESLNAKKLEFYARCGVNRISLGVQSFNDQLLKVCNRKHTGKQAMDVIQKIQASKISNFSIDLIFGLPGQTLEDVNRDLDIFFSFNIPHLSIYSLQIEENSVFGKQGILPCDEDLEADMFECIEKRLKEHDYIHYEISSFCLKGYESKHNMAYWQDLDFYGIGCGASGKINNIRYDNTSSLKSYLLNGPQKHWIKEPLCERAMDAIMMALRTKKGLNIQDWNRRYSMDFKIRYASVLEKYDAYFQQEDSYVFLNEGGFEILNTILVDFMMVE